MTNRLNRRAVLAGLLFPAVAGAAPARPGEVPREAPGDAPGEVKVLELVARQPSLSHEAFLEAWQGRNAAGAAQALPGLLGYAVSDVAMGPPRPDINALPVGAEVDGIGEFRFRSPAAARAAFGSRTGRAWLAQQAAFAASVKTFVLKDDIIVPVASPVPPLRNYALLNHKPGATTASFLHDWHKVHGDMAVHVPFLRGFVLGDTVGDVDAQFKTAGLAVMTFGEVDGVAQAYYNSTDDQTKMRASPEAKAWFEQGAATFNQIKSYNATEKRIV